MYIYDVARHISHKQSHIASTGYDIDISLNCISESTGFTYITRIVSNTPRFYAIRHTYDTCHMATDMLQLPYGNERIMHDGRRTTSASQRIWMEPTQAKAARKEISICSEVERRRDLYYSGVQLANNHARRSSEENSSSLNKTSVVIRWPLIAVVQTDSSNLIRPTFVSILQDNSPKKQGASVLSMDLGGGRREFV